ncbi:hypothetical protein LL033_17475 [Clostridium estertheticum]|uniref:hypothetical protein n=1 Tax=Clostridium estertheticum TaxID=238834 RepID=UPI001C0B3464|nr:hypothetical protein [Clostridium estertheticum]MBU3216640.1 hypothetical protein [Clostridium estertheticum]WAG54405.1 hypothetical protein LL033_17475 [Clostridium estertheticum]
MIIIKYINESEVKAITDAQIAKGMHLISVSNVTEGNFLGFDDRDVVPTVIPNDPVQSPLQLTILEALQTQILELQNKLLESEGVI